MTNTGYFLHIDSRHLPLCKKFIMHSSTCTYLASTAFSVVTTKLVLEREREYWREYRSSWRISELEVGSWDVWESILIIKIFSNVRGNYHVHCHTVFGWVFCLSQSLSKLILSVIITVMGLYFFQNIQNLMQIENKSNSKF